MAESEADKTQPATPRRRQQAIEQGNVWQPRELAPAAAVLVAALAATLAGPGLWAALAAYLADSLARAEMPANDGVPVAALAVRVPLLWPAALAAAVAVVTIGLSLATTRHVSLAMLAPKWQRISPVAGLGRIFSLGGLAGAATAVLKLLAVGGVALAVAAPLLPALAHVGEERGGLAVIGGAVVRLAGAAALAMLGIAIVDGALSWLLRERKLRMTLEEVKRESRENDGAPEVKAAIKRAQFAAASRRMRTTMAEASVVVVNPVHFAVAMRYLPGSDAAPVVVEKGRLEMAQAIIAVARELGVPVVRTPRLARALFFTAKLGTPVREELFGAVATILAFVMRFDAPEQEAAPAVFVPPAFDFDAAGQRRKPGAGGSF
ncbi:flagellar biosynthetic protein FlhB [Polymorphobacter fuscus]|uniref:EscU/YscU/HrcU family type III secretion system export apparatus switch protein n=1 Tax=Sandarakinorhabdus fusca TaxID=1439888 RepID=UPI0014305CB8|nr:EscU/YscU/HrcU family type III secretion system export apparatus switch protein [Polymorphobacter fuscus]NJC07876.1 flagellar biosynthetic protein FlhB [Polymorphobacter fuscus]